MTDPKHNQAPPHEEHAAIARELDAEAGAWFSGVDIPDAGAAESVAAFLERVQAARKAAEADKETEYRPHKQAADAVTATYKPILATFASIETSARGAIAAYERRVMEAQAEAARKAHEEAEAQAEAARQAMLESAGDHEARQEAEAMTETAKRFQIAAKVIAKSDQRVRVGGRALAMRERVTVRLVDATALLKWMWVHHKDELIDWALAQAERDAKAGRQSIDGVEIIREKGIAA